MYEKQRFYRFLSGVGIRAGLEVIGTVGIGLTVIGLGFSGEPDISPIFPNFFSEIYFNFRSGRDRAQLSQPDQAGSKSGPKTRVGFLSGYPIPRKKIPNPGDFEKIPEILRKSRRF